MPQGLQIWNAAGQLILDTSTQILSMYDAFTVSSDGSQALPSLPGAEFIAATVPQGDATHAPDRAYVSGGAVQYDLNGAAPSREVKVFLI